VVPDLYLQAQSARGGLIILEKKSRRQPATHFTRLKSTKFVVTFQQSAFKRSTVWYATYALHRTLQTHLLRFNRSFSPVNVWVIPKDARWKTTICLLADKFSCDTYKEVEFTLEQVMKVQKSSRDSSTVSLTSALQGVGGQRHAPAAFLPGQTRYSLYSRLDGPWGGISRPQRDSIRGPSSP